MKNQYFGDINDYRKYGLLRQLAQGGQFKIGVSWMLTPSDNRNDGNILKYLKQEKIWKKYDSSLYEFLQACIAKEHRDVTTLEKAGIIPNALYFSPILQDSINARNVYFMAMHNYFQDCDLIFFDPDNGLEISSVKMGHKDSSKYLYYDEVVTSYQHGYSLLIYQHFPRENHQDFIQRITEKLYQITGATAIHTLKAASVAYFLLSQDKHNNYLQQRRIDAKSQWKNELA